MHRRLTLGFLWLATWGNLAGPAAPPLVETPSHPDVTVVSILPSVTDPAIQTFDSPHAIYLNRKLIVDQQPGPVHARHELLLWLTGTGGNAQKAAADFCKLAADLGYHVVSLMYPDDLAASACANDRNLDSFETFRLAIIQGGSATCQNGRKKLTITRPDSIESRLTKLLLHLKSIRPREHWEQFLNTNDTVKWETIAVAGQS